MALIIDGFTRALRRRVILARAAAHTWASGEGAVSPARCAAE